MDLVRLKDNVILWNANDIATTYCNDKEKLFEAGYIQLVGLESDNYDFIKHSHEASEIIANLTNKTAILHYYYVDRPVEEQAEIYKAKIETVIKKKLNDAMLDIDCDAEDFFAYKKKISLYAKVEYMSESLFTSAHLNSTIMEMEDFKK